MDHVVRQTEVSQRWKLIISKQLTQVEESIVSQVEVRELGAGAETAPSQSLQSVVTQVQLLNLEKIQFINLGKRD